MNHPELRHRTFRRILLIKPSALGDVVRCLPILYGLRGRFPQARISWLIRPEFEAVLPRGPILDEIITFQRKEFSRVGRQWGATVDFVGLVARLYRESFDLVLDLQGLFRSGFLSWCTQAETRIGQARTRELAGLFYTQRVPGEREGSHIVDQLWQFAHRLGFGEQEQVFALPDYVEAEAGLQSKLHPFNLQENDYAVFLVGGTETAKCWPADRWVRMVAIVRERYQLEVVLVGAGKSEIATAALISENTRHPVANLAGKTNLQELIQLLRKAKLVIGNDSGPLHIAAALGVPLVGLYGPTNPDVVGPYGQMAGVVTAGGTRRYGQHERYSRQAAHRMEAITVEMVAKKADYQWQHNVGRSCK